MTNWIEKTLLQVVKHHSQVLVRLLLLLPECLLRRPRQLEQLGGQRRVVGRVELGAVLARLEMEMLSEGLDGKNEAFDLTR